MPIDEYGKRSVSALLEGGLAMATAFDIVNINRPLAQRGVRQRVNLHSSLEIQTTYFVIYTSILNAPSFAPVVTFEGPFHWFH